MKKLFVFILFLSMGFSTLFSQAEKMSEKSKKTLAKVRKLMGYNRYEEAIKDLLKLKKMDSTLVEPYIYLAIIYENKKDKEAEKNEYIALNRANKSQFDGHLNLATLEFKAGNFNNALIEYESVLTNKNSPVRFLDISKDRIKQIKVILEIISKSGKAIPEKLSDNVNSDYDEYYPSFTVDNQTMYFTRNLVSKKSDDKNPYGIRLINDYNEDVYVSERDSNDWGFAKPVGPPINTLNNEGAISISPDGTFMIFTRCNGENCDLYISRNEDGYWSDPENLGPPINTRYYETNPSISADGKSIYFVSSRPGGYGETDIYVCSQLPDGNFSEPKNLGKGINSPKSEWSPYIHPDDNTLYFSTNGRIGLGKRDLYVSFKNEQGVWDSAVNLGSNINTPKDELCMIVDRSGKTAYFVSEGINNKGSGNNGTGNLDIYKIELPEYGKSKNMVSFLKGNVFNTKTKEKLVSEVQIIDLSNGKIVNTFNVGKLGNFLIPIQLGKEYAVNANKQGFLFYSDHIDLRNYNKITPFEKDIELIPIEAGAKIILKNIFYDTDKFDLKPESTPELDKVIQFLQSNPTVKIEINGFTDNTGSELTNKVLSKNRAKSVYEYIVSNSKTNLNRIKFNGLGSIQPVAPNTTEEGKAQNRRTELKVIE